MIDKLKSILKAIKSILPNQEKRKEKFFASARTNERTDKDGKKILMVDELDPTPCPMHEDYDDVDYKAKDE